MGGGLVHRAAHVAESCAVQHQERRGMHRGDHLQGAEIPYMVIGGQAVLLYGEPRLTKDVDVTLGVDLNRLPDVLQLVEKMRLTPLADPETFTRETMVLPCQDLTSGVRVDFIFSFSAYEHQALQRVHRADLGTTAVCFVSVEDLIIHKMVAGRPHDIEDVKSILARNRELDLSYLRHWLEAFSATLGRVLSEPFEDMLKRL